MTDGPYNESIRGPGNRGLGGIWALLNSIAGGLGSLPQIAADIAAIRVVSERDIPLLLARLTLLSGTANGSNSVFGTSLRDYLTTMLGSRQTALQQDSIIGGVLGTTAYLVRLEDILYGAPVSRPDGANNIVNRLRDNTNQLANSIGNAATSTPNFTALAWLALIANSTERSADCCEQVPVVPVVPLNPPPGPDFGCGLTNGPLRVTSFIKRVSGDGLPDTYTAQFAGLATASNSLLVNVPAAVPYGEINVIKAIQSQGVCLEWNLTDRATPIIGTRLLLGANTDIPGPSSSTFNPTATQGTFAFFPLNANEHLLFELDVVAGGPAPTLNYFLKWQTVGT